MIQNNVQDGNIDFDIRPDFDGPLGEFVQHYTVRDFDFGIILPEETSNELITNLYVGNLHDVSIGLENVNRAGHLSCIIPLTEVTLHLHHGDIHHDLVLRRIIICHFKIYGAHIYWE